MKCLFTLLLLWIPCFASSGIKITNHKDHSTVRYPVVLLRGDLSSDSSDLTIANLSLPADSEPIAVVRNGKFKALVRLAPGANSLLLIQGDEKRSFSLAYQPQTNPYYVRLIWLTDSTGDETYATPTDDEAQNYKGRLQTAAQLMQTFTAERMGDLAHGKKTFRLERDTEGEIIVHTMKGDLLADEYYALGDTNRYWGSIHQWLNKNHPDPFAKNIVLTAFTRKDQKTGKMRGHTALGGGNLGLFGSASVFTWPESLRKVNEAFSNDTIVDPKQVHDDSAGRATYWGVASTTIGATLHEMGHTFGLPHCTDGMGIMTRGFDHFHRVFTFHDPASRRNLKPKLFTDKEEAYFAPVSATFLQWSRWFQLNNKEAESKRNGPTIKQSGDTVTVSSEHGIPWIGIWAKDSIHDYRITESKPLQNKIVIPIKDLESRLKGQPVSKVSTIDGVGNHRAIKIEPEKE